MFDQPYIYLLFVGLAFTSAGFLVRDELWLRALVLTGGLFDIAFCLVQMPPLWGPFITNSVLVLINAALITVVMLERSLLFMSESDQTIFALFKTLTPGQFRRINRWATWKITQEDTVLIDEGQKVDKLFFINAPQFDITKQGQRYTATGPAFAGEMMLLQGVEASATVTVPPGTPYAEWTGTQLRRAMSKSKSLENALIARFGHDLANKVRYSVPITTPSN